MEENILISYFNDFIFCPASIYFHKLYGNLNKELYQNEVQISGTKSHVAIDSRRYSDRKNILQSIDVYSKEFNIQGKIDIFDTLTGVLVERKKNITTIYDGYIFQVYAQYYALTEMGYKVKQIRFHSMDDNKNYNIKLPCEDKEMDYKFRKLVDSIKKFDINDFIQTNSKKCKNCIYEPACDRSLIC